MSEIEEIRKALNVLIKKGYREIEGRLNGYAYRIDIVQVKEEESYGDPTQKLISTEELLGLFKLMTGQKLIGVTLENELWTLHFEDFVVQVKTPYVSPIYERIT